MKILILGAGKMGTWLADTLCTEYKIGVFDIDIENLKYLFNSQRFTDISEVKDFNPDLVINSVSLQHTEKAFDMVMPYLSDDCIISDITSVKNNMELYYEKIGKRFVSTHPMFGPTFGNIKDLQGQSVIIINESDEEGKSFFEHFYAKLGIKIYHLNFVEHDKTIAYSLTTPFTATMMFAACMEKQDAPGTTFQRHLQIAKGLFSEDDYLISEIMFNQYSGEQIDNITEELKKLSEIVKSKDILAMKKYINKFRKNI